MRVLDEIRSWWLELISPYIEKIQGEMVDGGFDPESMEHFAVTYALLVAAPDNSKGMMRAIESMAGFYGHCKKNEREGGGPINFDEIQGAFVLMSRRMQEALPEPPRRKRRIKTVEAKVCDVKKRRKVPRKAS